MFKGNHMPNPMQDGLDRMVFRQQAEAHVRECAGRVSQLKSQPRQRWGDQLDTAESALRRAERDLDRYR